MKMHDYHGNAKIGGLCFLLFPTVIFLYLMGLCFALAENKEVVINEVCSNNFSVAKDGNGNYSDYIELYNPGDEAIVLEGYYLSDDEENLQKYALDGVNIPAKGYYVVWLDGGKEENSPEAADRGNESEDSEEAADRKNESENSSEAAERKTKPEDSENKEVKFRISSKGETVFLSRLQDEKLVDYVTVPKLAYNTSYARTADGEGQWRLMTATAGRTNKEAEILPDVKLSEPVFSTESGFYEEAFTLKLTAAMGEDIYYTLDGSEPSHDSIAYEEGIAITDASQNENVYAARTDLSPTRAYTPSFIVDKATVVRAVSYNERSGSVSDIVTKVYFVGYEQREEYEEFPVISLVADPEDLFHPEYGIYTNGETFERYKRDGGMKAGELLDSFTDKEGKEHLLYMASNAFQSGKEWEREAVITYFDNEHRYCFSQKAGIRTAGQSTRGTPQKSFSIYGRKIYDDTVCFPYEFFENMSYSSIKLRNGGNANDTVKIKDAFLEELAADRNIAVQRSKPCIVFLNGEYWGIYNIRERYKEEYLTGHYGVDAENVWMIDSGLARVGGAEAEKAYKYMTDVVTECELVYDDTYALACELLDIQSLIDYCCINLYIDNRDISFIQNMALWRTAEPDGTEYGDGKWRWMLFDTDMAIHSDSNDESVKKTWIQNSVLMNEPVVKSLLDNARFRQQFCITFMDIANTTFEEEEVRRKLVEWQELYRTQIVKNHRRFFNAEFDADTFDSYIEEMDGFFAQRFSYAMESLKEAFGLEGSLEMVTVKINETEGGYVRINTALIKDRNEWSGEYFNDYPIELTAVANEGWRFAGWQGDVTGRQKALKKVIPEGGMTVEAIFEKTDK